MNIVKNSKNGKVQNKVLSRPQPSNIKGKLKNPKKISKNWKNSSQKSKKATRKM